MHDAHLERPSHPCAKLPVPPPAGGGPGAAEAHLQEDSEEDRQRRRRKLQDEAVGQEAQSRSLDPGAVGRNLRPKARRSPFVSTTDVSIAATCRDACPFKGGGCFAEAGFTRFMARRLDAAAEGLTADQVIAEEAQLIDTAFKGGRVPQDGARGGRDLRLHVGGDVGSTLGARLLAGAAARWRDRGGGAVWSFTHAWREVPREAWGPISVLASVERPEDIEAARAAGYAAALVVDRFPSARAFTLPGSDTKIVPCPAETRSKTCVECRLCLDADKLLDRNVAIAFEAHGPTARRAREALVDLSTQTGQSAPSERLGDAGAPGRGAA